MIMCIPLWFVGGLLTGFISPGRTFMEPVIAAFLVAVPCTYMLIQNQTVRIMPHFLYVVMAAIGVMFSMVGAYLGEKWQLSPVKSEKKA